MSHAEYTQGNTFGYDFLHLPDDLVLESPHQLAEGLIGLFHGARFMQGENHRIAQAYPAIDAEDADGIDAINAEQWDNYELGCIGMPLNLVSALTITADQVVAFALEHKDRPISKSQLLHMLMFTEIPINFEEIDLDPEQHDSMVVEFAKNKPARIVNSNPITELMLDIEVYNAVGRIFDLLRGAQDPSSDLYAKTCRAVWLDQDYGIVGDDLTEKCATYLLRKTQIQDHEMRPYANPRAHFDNIELSALWHQVMTHVAVEKGYVPKDFDDWHTYEGYEYFDLAQYGASWTVGKPDEIWNTAVETLERCASRFGLDPYVNQLEMRNILQFPMTMDDAIERYRREV